MPEILEKANYQKTHNFSFELYPYARSPDQDADRTCHHKVIIVGAGPIGLSLALDLGLQNIPVLVLDNQTGISGGSRAICFSKRTLEIARRYGFDEKLVQKGIIWNVGKVFHHDKKVYEFNLLPETGHRQPAFINLQQPYFEKYLVEEIRNAQTRGFPITIRGGNQVSSINSGKDKVTLFVNTVEGPYQLSCDWLVACDGASSDTRKILGIEPKGKIFLDSFLITDIKMRDQTFPTERWFWFAPNFTTAASTLVHRQPDDCWRIDFQIGWQADRKLELEDESIKLRLDSMFGKKIDYEIVWKSIYTFQCRRIENFRHRRIFFAGDAAHQLSPFGARGANSGMQDVDNLGWKLGLVVKNLADESLLNSYHEERSPAADENLKIAIQTTNFITPKSGMMTIFRDAVLELAEHYPFARPLVNSGRLSSPYVYQGLSLCGVDNLPAGPKISCVGSVCPDAPLADNQTFLLDLLGDKFILLALTGVGDSLPAAINEAELTVDIISMNIHLPSHRLMKERYLGERAAKAFYLIRPDQYIAARWGNYDEAAIRQTIRQIIGRK